MLRRIRTTLAVLVFIGITLLFLDVTGILHTYLGWLAKVQFLPALLAMNLAVVAVLLVLTLIFGRIYCSVICPLGILQDFFARLRPRKNKKVGRYSYSPEVRWRCSSSPSWQALAPSWPCWRLTAASAASS